MTAIALPRPPIALPSLPTAPEALRQVLMSLRAGPRRALLRRKTSTAYPWGAPVPFAWWDADQETFSNGATLTQITDRGPSELHLTSITGTPTFQTGVQNGKSAYRFSGGNTWTASRASLGLTGPAATIFFAGKSAATGAVMVMQYGSGVAASGSFNVIDNAATGQWAVYGTSATISSPNSAADWATDNVARIIVHRFNSAGSPTGQKWNQGVLEAGSLPTTNWGNLSNGTFYIAGLSGSGMFTWQGDIYEVIIFDSALSDADYNKVEDYMAAKYAITVS